MNCVTSIDAVGLNVGGFLALGLGGLRQIRDTLSGLSPFDRRRATWDDNSSFVATLGLDPEAVLGPRPEPAVRENPSEVISPIRGAVQARELVGAGG